LTAPFRIRLASGSSSFSLIKLEEPDDVFESDRNFGSTNGASVCSKDWGGMYMLDLIPAGICGRYASALAVSVCSPKVFQLRH